ncbi:MAG TPA: glutathione S-transferase family protein [Methylibium sp.]|uniref:glutathione S-transferase family protein n=1 Tax=Methylibium sp. TaxID=2067992 RepID=UPI002DBF8216|nr:glutathione S-transferase family protein [Methylibium sp.]HEU4458469.1 glutathione S-transferase family protein [Methylibium sp.]
MTTTIELHHAPSSAAMAPHILLTEIGRPFALVPVDLDAGAQRDADYLRLNPNGVVPTYVERGPQAEPLVLFESAAIGLHLADAHPQAQLAPPVGSRERAHYTKWMLWLAGTLHANLIPYFYPQRWAAEGNAAGAAEVKACAEARVGPLLDRLDAELARHGAPWLLGEHYRAVDAHALMLCRWTRRFAHPARERPALGAYLGRVLERPAVRTVFEREAIADRWV